MTRIGAARDIGSRLAWLAPMIAFLAAFMVLPLFDVVRLSFTTASIIEPEYSYTLRSYARVFGDKDFLGHSPLPLFSLPPTASCKYHWGC